MRVIARPLVPLAVVLMLLSGCTSSKSDGDGTQGGDPETSTTADGSRDDVGTQAAPSAEVADMLEQAGITVVENDEQPPFLGYTTWQASNLETTSISGQQVDLLAPVPAGTAPLSAFVVGWVERAASPGAKAAAKILEGQDLDHAPQVAFPMSVLAMFVHDALAGLSTKPHGMQPFNRVPASAVEPSPTKAPCSYVAGKVSGALNDLFNAIKVDNRFDPNASFGGQVLSFLKALYNYAVDAAHYFVNGLVSVFSAPVVEALSLGIGALATITEVGSTLAGWKAKVEKAPAAPLATGKLPNRGDAATLTFKAEGLKELWPPALLNCAKETGTPVPEGIEPGSATDWTFSLNEGNYLAARGGDPFEVGKPKRIKVGADQRASLDVQAVGQEPKTFESTRLAPVPAVGVVTVSADSSVLSKLRTFANNRVDGVIHKLLTPLRGSPAEDEAKKAIAPVTDKVHAFINDVDAGRALLGLTSTQLTEVKYHLPPNDALSGIYDWQGKVVTSNAECVARGGSLTLTVTGEDPDRTATLKFSTSESAFTSSMNIDNEVNINNSRDDVTSLIGAKFTALDGGAATVEGFADIGDSKRSCSLTWEGTRRKPAD